jgi:hypothetical protein
VVKYHGLARRYLTAPGFLMRPLLNGGTLGGPMTRGDPDRRQSFQDNSFDVTYARGDVLERLLGFGEAPEYPQKLLLRLGGNGWCSLFLSAFIAHWDALSETEVVEMHQDYEGIPLIDYGKQFNLDESRVLAITCTPLGGAASVVLEFEAGSLRLHVVDPPDPHSDSALAWQPTQPSDALG